MMETRTDEAPHMEDGPHYDLPTPDGSGIPSLQFTIAMAVMREYFASDQVCQYHKMLNLSDMLRPTTHQCVERNKRVEDPSRRHEFFKSKLFLNDFSDYTFYDGTYPYLSAPTDKGIVKLSFRLEEKDYTDYKLKHTQGIELPNFNRLLSTVMIKHELYRDYQLLYPLNTHQYPYTVKIVYESIGLTQDILGRIVIRKQHFLNVRRDHVITFNVLRRKTQETKTE
jgi:hypothetical protein